MSSMMPSAGWASGFTPPTIMGILNLTPDSFSDGGAHGDHDAAVSAALAMVVDGAAIIDVGGESTRPGATPVTPLDEQRRVLPVIEALVERGVTVSIDTLHASTAQAALDAGVHYVNDVSGGLFDEGMAEVVAASDATFIASHWGGGADAAPKAGDIAGDVAADLGHRLEAFARRGLSSDRVILDPGLGFGKDAEQNWQLIAGISRLSSLGTRVMLGHSRKRFIGALLRDGAPMTSRDLPSAVVSAVGAQAGVWGVRVHDVPASRVAFEILSRIAMATPSVDPSGEPPVDHHEHI